jgi:hypothetical protein
MAGLDPAIYGSQKEKRTWMRGSSSRMTIPREREVKEWLKS